ncbi:MAG: hypothetical protein R3A10_14215 [Caldilineaceae bacterium]
MTLVLARLTAPKASAWTANVYLLGAAPPRHLAHGRLGAGPGLAACGCPGDARPSQQELAETAARWQPWRAQAARIVWHGVFERA